MASPRGWLCSLAADRLTGLRGGVDAEKAGYYVKLSGGYLNTTKDIDAAGDKVDKDGEGELRDVNCTAYLEYGISNELTLVATAPYKSMKDTRTFQTGTAAGEAVGVRGRGGADAAAPVGPGFRGLRRGG